VAIREMEGLSVNVFLFSARTRIREWTDALTLDEYTDRYGRWTSLYFLLPLIYFHVSHKSFVFKLAKLSFFALISLNVN
jgi:hypothetical protein